MRKYQKAINCYDKAINLDSTNSDLYINKCINDNISW